MYKWLTIATNKSVSTKIPQVGVKSVSYCNNEYKGNLPKTIMYI